MAFFYLLIALLLVFGIVGAIVYFFTDLTNRLKYTILASLILGWSLVAGYSYIQSKRRIYHDMLYYRFMHGKVLLCKDPFGKEIAVDRDHFNFVSGTMVFVGKERSPYEGLIVPIDRCKER